MKKKGNRLMKFKQIKSKRKSILKKIKKKIDADLDKNQNY